MSNKALVVIDVQEIFFTDKENYPYKADELIEKINELITKARKNDVPIIFVRHSDEEYMKFGSSVWELSRELDVSEKDFYIEKKTPDSFYQTDLKALLEKEKIEEIYLCGLQTDFCIDTTCRSAFGKNIKAFLVEDAHSTYDSEFIKAEQIINHHNKIIGEWFAKLISTKDVSFRLLN